ncbi:MAG: DNA mismatch repair protein MutS [Desulfobacteraceae bacterium]|nr:MAG: DNA mismatch repair protein MutS [Desulfobacteraceae bacterium]
MRKKKRKKTGAFGKRSVSSEGEEIFNPIKSVAVDISKPLDAHPLIQPESSYSAVSKDKDSELFLEAMNGVTPISGLNRRFTPSPRLNIKPVHPAPDDELEAMAHLSDLIGGQTEMDITFSEEYIEGCVQGFSRDLMKRLRNGQFPLQSHLDLHGLTKQEAEARVRDFLLDSFRLGRRCVLIVHGRGLNSENNIPVLKERIPIWLARGPAKKIVLAFSTARPYDGGTGAVYVFIRKQRAKPRRKVP